MNRNAKIVSVMAKHKISFEHVTRLANELDW